MMRDLPYASLLNNKEFEKYYEEYIRKRKIPKERILSNKDDLRKIHNELWKTVQELYVESEGGIYIDNIGYFCHVIQPKRKWRISGLTNRPEMPRTNGYRYRHMVIELHDSRNGLYMINNKKIFYHIYKSILPHVRDKMNKKKYKLRIKEIASYIKCKKERGSQRKLRSLYK